MKSRILFFLLLTAVGASSLPLHAYTAPTPEALDSLLANPDLIRKLLGDATGEQAAEFLLSLIDRLDKADLVDRQRDYLIAYYTSRITFLLSVEQAEVMATKVLAAAPRHLVPAVLVGLSVGGRGSNEFLATLRTLVGDDKELLTAINNPNVTLSDPVYNHLIASLGIAQSLPPVVIDSLPPPIPVGIRPPSPPIRRPGPNPIPQPYAGQG